jgi:hypothetical protein
MGSTFGKMGVPFVGSLNLERRTDMENGLVKDQILIPIMGSI